MRDRRAADAEVFAMRYKVPRAITPEQWLGAAYQIQTGRAPSKNARSENPSIRAMLTQGIVQKYLKERPFVAAKEWPSQDITRVMRDVTPFDITYLFYERRNGSVRGGRKSGPLLVAYASGMSLEYITEATGLTEQEALDEMLEQAEGLWEKHVGFVFWALNIDYQRLHVFDFGSRDRTLKARLTYANAFNGEPFYVARQSFHHWRVRNPVLWERLKTGQYFRRKRKRVLPERRWPRGEEYRREDRWWPDVPWGHRRNTVRYARSRVW